MGHVGAGVAQCYENVAQETFPASSTHGAARKAVTEFVFVELRESRQIRPLVLGTRGELRIERLRLVPGVSVVGANLLANIAAEDPLTQIVLQFGRKLAAVLYGEIGDAASGV